MTPSPADNDTWSRIGPELTIEGEITGRVDLAIDGRVLGTIEARTVVIGEGAHVDARIRAERLVIHGRYFGRAMAATVEVSATAQVSGSLMHNSMHVERGAMVDGLMPWRPESFFEKGAHEYQIDPQQQPKQVEGSAP